MRTSTQLRSVIYLWRTDGNLKELAFPFYQWVPVITLHQTWYPVPSPAEPSHRGTILCVCSVLNQGLLVFLYIWEGGAYSVTLSGPGLNSEICPLLPSQCWSSLLTFGFFVDTGSHVASASQQMTLNSWSYLPSARDTDARHSAFQLSSVSHGHKVLYCLRSLAFNEYIPYSSIFMLCP